MGTTFTIFRSVGGWRLKTTYFMKAERHCGRPYKLSGHHSITVLCVHTSIKNLCSESKNIVGKINYQLPFVC